MTESDYRFSEGNLVLFKRRNGWFEGEVKKVGGSHGGRSIAYVVSRPEANEEFQIVEDTDNFIRRKPNNLAPDSLCFQPPIPEDPFAFAYTGKTNNPFSEDGFNLAEEFQKLDSVASAQIQPDGSIKIQNKDGSVQLSSSYKFEAQTVCGVPTHNAMFAGSLVMNRRIIGGMVGIPDLIANFLDAVPTETRLGALVQASKKSNRKMLQLADGLMFGFHGWPRDPDRAGRCYRAAAFGCSERDEKTRCAAFGPDNGVPVGSPEAMIATLQGMESWIKVFLFEASPMDRVPHKNMLVAAHHHKGGIDLVNQMFFWLYHSAVRGWVTPTTIGYSMACHEIDTSAIQAHLQKVGAPDDTMEVIRNVWNYRQMEMNYQKRLDRGVVPRGNPTEATIASFKPKSMEIFQSLPSTLDQVYIEFREVPRVPFPIAVYALIPAKKKVLKVLVIPEHLQLSPFSSETFEYVWLRLAYELHLGDPASKQRERPSECFMVLDSYGNRQFAEYLRQMLDGSETQVRLVTHDEMISENLLRRQSLGDLVEAEEVKFLSLPKYLNGVESAEGSVLMAAQQESARRYRRGLRLATASDDHTQAQYREEANQLMEQGISRFGVGAYGDAVKCYSTAIFLLRQTLDLDQDGRRLLGILLAGRATSLWKMQSNTIEFGRLLLTSAARDCRLALGSRQIRDALPREIIKNLKFLLDRVDARLERMRANEGSRIWVTWNAIESYFIGFSWRTLSSILWLFSWIRTQLVFWVWDVALSIVKKWVTAAVSEANKRATTIANETPDTVPHVGGSETTDRESATMLVNDTANAAPQTEGLETTHGITVQRRTRDPDTALQQQSPSSQHRRDVALLETGRVIHDNSLAKNSDDGCPVCLKTFSEELEETLVCVLACGDHALCVECVCYVKKGSDRTKQQMKCPLCRAAVEPDFVEDLSYQIIETDQSLGALMEKLPLDDADDRENVLQRLLWTHEFRVDRVVDSLEKMLDDQVRAQFFRCETDFTHGQKEEIYQTARRPVLILQEKVHRLVEEHRTTFDAAKLKELNATITQVRNQLAFSRVEAREQIYTRMNEVGNMGAESSLEGGSSLIPVDYHGMHVGEMLSKFQELVKPILPVVKEVMIITGRGLHSANNEGKLKKALIRHIDNKEDDIRWERVEENPGALKVLWRPR